MLGTEVLSAKANCRKIAISLTDLQGETQLLPIEPCPAREGRDIHRVVLGFGFMRTTDLRRGITRKSASRKGSDGNAFAGCTISGQGLVDGLHSLENTCTYKRVFFVDSKIRRSTTGSFFDNFLSFSGWCGVRGSSEVTFLIARLGRRASKGL